MLGWNGFVGLLGFSLSTLANLYGGNLGLAIVTLSIAVRLALLPLALRMARHARAQQKLLHEIRFDIDKLKKKYKSSPQELAGAMSKLYQEHGFRPVDATNLVGMVVQVLLGAGVYSAIRRGLGSGGHFLWIRNLAQPNLPLTIATGVMTFLAALLGPHLPQQSRTAATVLPAILTLIFAWRLAAGVALYWAASTAVTGLQGLLLRRDEV
ncbi:MAG TPA: membrane protein insertase YidC [Terriglobales bacterium]|jgi:YidC/Oxa1 family membrane protein insertase|nr:membrane protein insertase YidC [Terriglobales bacterium]